MVQQLSSGAGADPALPIDQRPLVVVVEDNRTNARLTSTILQAAGYQAAVAYDGDEGLRLVKQLLPALVILDLQMPGMDGLTLAKHLKADPHTASLPLVVLTAHAMDEHRERAMAAGCTCFITKPIRYQQFVADIAQVLEQHPSLGVPQA